ncbi:MAG: YebC/PmpR family DNA-binding transcriptional regulator [Saprospiraceae bacterium]|jgi:YebC/PmpR family DNA-binding regulatory protein|nr:YebC/PmpR family DNA-binding transcriptional regulator [Saprospiraceae bacterium]
MGRAFEYRKDRKMKRWGAMAKAFTRIGKEIAIAVKEGGSDPNYNPRLRMAVQSAKMANMPKANVENAIKRATSKDAENYSEVLYEGYAPHGIAVMVETATDNPTRTVANVRMHFNKGGGAMGTSGSVDYMFSRKSVFRIKNEGVDLEFLELELIDFGLEEMKVEDDELVLYAAFADFGSMQKGLESKGIEVLSALSERIPTMTKKLTDDQVEEVIKLIDRLEDDDDIQFVYHNMDMSE